MKKTIIIFLSFIFLQTILFALDITQNFPNTIVPISNISIERLWEAQKDDCSIEDFYYQQEIWEKEREYEDSLSNNISQDKSFLGNWYLTDQKNKIVEESRIAPIQFTLISNGVSYRKQSSTSYVYEIAKDSYLVIPTWDAGMIKMLKIYDDKMYVYNLDGDTWYLNDIHKTGNYYKKQ